jgi:hypothetical protein
LVGLEKSPTGQGGKTDEGIAAADFFDYGGREWAASGDVI